jgi:hypothetical protein
MVEFILLFLEPVRGKIPYLLHVYLWIVIFLWPVSRVMARLLHPLPKLRLQKAESDTKPRKTRIKAI